MKYFIVLCVLEIVWCTNYHLRRNTKCTISHDCPSSAPCCRDANNQKLPHQLGYFPSPLDGAVGTCSSVLGKKGDVCDSCGCESGYKCYRPVSGRCCPPMRCYNATWVEQQQHYWANCNPVTCFYPP